VTADSAKLVSAAEVASAVVSGPIFTPDGAPATAFVHAVSASTPQVSSAARRLRFVDILFSPLGAASVSALVPRRPRREYPNSSRGDAGG
jgi:hypothetical protein